MRCKHYKIHLNPHKCIFCVQSGRLLGFIVSKYGICVDPSKVDDIINLPPPSTLCQLQSLQERRFIPNYAKLTKRFTQLLKQSVPFIWDEIANKYFDVLKNELNHASLLHLPNYH